MPTIKRYQTFKPMPAEDIAGWNELTPLVAHKLREMEMIHIFKNYFRDTIHPHMRTLGGKSYTTLRSPGNPPNGPEEWYNIAIGNVALAHAMQKDLLMVVQKMKTFWTTNMESVNFHPTCGWSNTQKLTALWDYLNVDGERWTEFFQSLCKLKKPQIMKFWYGEDFRINEAEKMDIFVEDVIRYNLYGELISAFVEGNWADMSIRLMRMCP